MLCNPFLIDLVSLRAFWHQPVWVINSASAQHRCLPRGPVCDVVIKQNDVCLSLCGIFFFFSHAHSFCVSLCCRVNGTICWWMWNGTTASQRCPTLSTSTWCRIATMRTVRLPFVRWNTSAHVHFHSTHQQKVNTRTCCVTQHSVSLLQKHTPASAL